MLRFSGSSASSSCDRCGCFSWAWDLLASGRRTVRKTTITLSTGLAKPPRFHSARSNTFDERAGCYGSVQAFVSRQNHLTAPLSTLSLVRSHPHLAALRSLRHPRGLVALLHHCEVGRLERFCDACPTETLRSALPELLRLCEPRQLATVLAPLLNDSAFHETLILTLQQVEIERLSRIINGSSPQKLEIVLKSCSPEVVVGHVNEVAHSRVGAMLRLVNKVPASLSTILTHCSDPMKSAAVLNYVDSEVILCLLGKVSAWRIARILECFPIEHYLPDGVFIKFLKHLEGECRFTREKVAPFLQLVDPEVVHRLVQGVKAEQLLEVLRRVGARGVARILDNTNVDLIISMWNGPLEQAVFHGAGTLSAIQKDAVAARTIKQVTDQMQLGLLKLQTLDLEFLRSRPSSTKLKRVRFVTE